MEKKTKTTTTVKKSGGSRQVRDGRNSNASPVHRRSDGGTLNPGPGKKK